MALSEIGGGDGRPRTVQCSGIVVSFYNPYDVIIYPCGYPRGKDGLGVTMPVGRQGL